MSNNVKFYNGNEINLPSSNTQGAFYVTNDTGKMYYDTGAEKHLIGENLDKSNIGINNTLIGKAFKILNKDSSTSSYTLSSVEGLEIGDIYSAVLVYNYPDAGRITSINSETNVITVDFFCDDNTNPQDYSSSRWQYYFYINEKPTLGDFIVDNHMIAVGDSNVATGINSIAVGYGCKVTGKYAQSTGISNYSCGYNSFTSGRGNISSGTTSHTEGTGNVTLGTQSHTEGKHNISTNRRSHTQGFQNINNGTDGFTGGLRNINDGTTSFVHGESNAIANGCLRGAVFGYNNLVFGTNCLVNGSNNIVGVGSSTYGLKITSIEYDLYESSPITKIFFDKSDLISIEEVTEFKFYYYNSVLLEKELNYKLYSKSLENINATADKCIWISGENKELVDIFNKSTTFKLPCYISIESLPEAMKTNGVLVTSTRTNTSKGIDNLISGTSNTVSGNYSIVSGNNNEVSGNYNLCSGYSSTLAGTYSFSIGSQNTVSGNMSFVAGEKCKNYGKRCAAIGYANTVGAENSLNSVVSSVAIGSVNTVSSSNSFVSGEQSKVEGKYSFSHGYYATATSENATAFGRGVNAQANYQFVIGKYNKNDKSDTDDTGLFIIGNGANGSSRSDAFRVTRKGDVYASGDVYANKKKLATEEYVNNKNPYSIKNYKITEILELVSPETEPKFSNSISFSTRVPINNPSTDLIFIDIDHDSATSSHYEAYRCLLGSRIENDTVCLEFSNDVNFENGDSYLSSLLPLNITIITGASQITV